MPQYCKSKIKHLAEKQKGEDYTCIAFHVNGMSQKILEDNS